jgi:hypothetical protein
VTVRTRESWHMTDPHAISVGMGGNIDVLDGHTSYLGRASETEWFAARYVQGGALAKLATIEEVQGPLTAWVVHPVSPLYDVEEYDTWDGARRAAFKVSPAL